MDSMLLIQLSWLSWYSFVVWSLTSGKGRSARSSAGFADDGALTSAMRRLRSANVLLNVSTGIVTAPPVLALSALVFSMPRTVTVRRLAEGDSSVTLSPTLMWWSLANSPRTIASDGPSFDRSVDAPLLNV